MANSLLRVTQRLSAESILSHALQKPSRRINVSAKCQSFVSIAINADKIPDVSPTYETCLLDNKPPHCLNPQTLKEKEKGDWRFLTMEEKKQLCHMSLSQSCDIEPADELKTILASTFTAMGLITICIYTLGFGNLVPPV